MKTQLTEGFRWELFFFFKIMKSAKSSDGCLCVQEMECEASGPSVSRTHPPPPQDEEDGWTVVRKKK